MAVKKILTGVSFLPTFSLLNQKLRGGMKYEERFTYFNGHWRLA